MLSAYAAEVVAFIDGEAGEFICYDCAHKALDRGEFDRSERGLGSLSPVIRYSLDEMNGERVYEAAEERILDLVEEYVAPHAETTAWHIVEGWKQRPAREVWSDGGYTRRYYRLVDKIAEKLGDSYGEVCGDCGEVIS